MKIQDLLFKCAEKIAQYGFTDRVDGQTIQLAVCRGAQRVIDLENMLIAEREEKRRFELLAKDLSKQLEDATAQLAGRVDYKDQWDGYINNKISGNNETH